MPAREEHSLTKEYPLATLDETLKLVRPGMPYHELRTAAGRHTNLDVPTLLKPRFLLMDRANRVVYDRFLSLVESRGVNTPVVRKVMYFTWAWRDERLRRFICEIVAPQGRWDVARLEDVYQSSFFEQWYPRSARKARSNIENFLSEVGIYRRDNRTIHLELDDGWLAEAMLVAAQHEPDRSLRPAMARDPVGTLLKLGLHSLANISSSEAQVLEVQPVADVNQLEEDAEAVTEGPPTKVWAWKDREVKPILLKAGVTPVNSVALERANASHLLLERLAAASINAKSLEPLYNEAIDMYYMTDSGTVLMEMKSSHARNLHTQVRRGVSQLLEYRYVERERLGDVTAMVLLIEIEPPVKKQWLVEFLESIDIVLAWRERETDRLVTTSSIPPDLEGIVEPY